MATKKKRKPTDRQRVAKVKRLLKKFEPWDGRETLLIQKAVRIGDSVSGEVLLYLGASAWTLSNSNSLDGVIGGFNMLALSVVCGLRKLGLLSVPDMVAFDSWFHKHRRESEGDSELHRAKEIAHRHGYVLRRKAKAPGSED